MSRQREISDEMLAGEGDETDLPRRIIGRWRKPDPVRRMPREREAGARPGRREARRSRRSGV